MPVTLPERFDTDRQKQIDAELTARGLDCGGTSPAETADGRRSERLRQVLRSGECVYGLFVAPVLLQRGTQKAQC